MKEQRIVIEIGRDGGISADADGFTDGACLEDLERLLDTLGGEEAQVKRKPDAGRQRVARTQAVKKGGKR